MADGAIFAKQEDEDQHLIYTQDADRKYLQGCYADNGTDGDLAVLELL